MVETLQEFCDSRGVPLRVDRQAGVIRGVKILGLQSRNGRTYLPEALRQAAGLYEEAKVNVNHPKGNPGSPRDYQDRIGVMRGVVAREGEGLFADFHFNPKHALAEQLVWDAEHAPENVGFSHNVEARTLRRGEQVAVEAITRVQSVDLVADPATTRGLFEAAEGDSPIFVGQKLGQSPEVHENVQAVLDNLTADQLQRCRPDLIEELYEQQAARLEELQREVKRLKAVEALHQKTETILGLLDEFHLPPPYAGDARSRAITSDRFVETLHAADSEPTMRKLVEERARLVRALGGGNGSNGTHQAGPVSRDQQLVDGAAAIDVKGFVEAIT